MSDWMRQVLESKRQARKRLAALPFAQKFVLLEKLRDRSLAIAANLRNPTAGAIGPPRIAPSARTPRPAFGSSSMRICPPPCCARHSLAESDA